MLDHIDLEYRSGLHLLLGPNGAGKTTLFRVLAGVLPPLHGEVLINGRDPHRDPGAKALIGVAGHRAALAPRLTVADNLRYWARARGLPVRDRERQVGNVMARMQLADIAERRAGQLSRGQIQRASVAKALLGDPPVLLLDEPTAGVDPAMAIQLRAQLRSLADDGYTVLTSTHELAEVGELADDVTLLHDGRIAGQGRPAELRNRLFGRGYRLRLRGRGDLAGALGRLGYPAEPATHGGVTVEVADEDQTERLIGKLVAEGIGIREVCPADNVLQDVYLRLQNKENDANGR